MSATAVSGTAVAAAPAQPVSTGAADLENWVDKELTIQLPNNVKDTLVHTKLKKGKYKGRDQYFLKLNLEEAAPFSRILTAVGKINFNREIAALVRDKCRDATADAKDDKGEVTDVAWAKAFGEQWEPGSRGSGTGIKFLREKKMEVFAQLNPFIIKLAQGTQLSQDDNSRYLTLLADYSDLDTKIEEKSRTGKKKAA